LRIEDESEAVVFLRDWQERTWRGLQLAVRPLEKGWRIRLNFPPGATWFDEAWMDDGEQTLRLEIKDGRLNLGGFPPGRTYRIGLPMFLGSEDQVLTLEGLEGRAVFLVGTDERPIGPGESLVLDLSREDLFAVGPPPALADGQVRIRTRPRPAMVEVTIDPEAEKLLRSLGYVGR
jgi:hypothetical protein